MSIQFASMLLVDGWVQETYMEVCVMKVRNNDDARASQVNAVLESVNGLLTKSDWLYRQSEEVQDLFNNCIVDDDNNVDDSGFTVTFRFNFLSE